MLWFKLRLLLMVTSMVLSFAGKVEYMAVYGIATLSGVSFPNITSSKLTI